ncbi:hypothetical protein ANCDUO_03427 [Ancylostoma duodenale]|uniref:Integrase catalytic domain-containing protein n=1 Tax=Ancylostoma duodenale TaxID=51022 RepID=A0A0C2H3X3_9BILA|nr:hypothetical protein ANCDUO_03427 [Ancylostoma duodenale]
MAACTYIAHEGEQTLIMARTKLPSIKEKHTIPKMEMNAVTIAARLSLTIYEELRKAININEIVIPTDSEIVLNWIKSPKEKKFRGLLVTNRINEIMKIVEKLRDEGVDIQFGYIATQHNPADCATRGLTAEELKNHNWWDGPDFSKKHRMEWPTETQLFTPVIEATETTTVDVVTTTGEGEAFPWSRFSSLKKMVRTTAYIRRFVSRCRERSTLREQIHNDPPTEQPSSLTGEEVRIARTTLMKIHQEEHRDSLTQTKLKNLNIKESDQDGLLRCYGRLGNSHIPEEAKNPILIAPNTELAKLIILEAHGPLHCTTGHTMSNVRQKYWIPRLRQQTKTVIRECLKCQRRGIPDSVTCDNAPTFALGEEILNDTVQATLESEEVIQFMANREIVWKKITPYAPWQGGFYERLIQTVKRALYKTLGSKTVTEDTLRRVLTEIEASLNSRPLTYQESEADDLPILRPVDFLQKDMLITRAGTTNPINQDDQDESYLPPDEAAKLRTRTQAEAALKESMKLTEAFWKVWQTNYLTALREAHKINTGDRWTSTKVPKEGDIVLISDGVLPRNAWKIGHVTKTVKSKDGGIREVELRGPNGSQIKRPPNLLIPLEIQDETVEDKDVTEKQPQEEKTPIPTQEGQEKPTAHRNLRPQRTRKYPYDPKEYEVYYVSRIQKHIPDKNLARGEAPHRGREKFRNPDTHYRHRAGFRNSKTPHRQGIRPRDSDTSHGNQGNLRSSHTHRRDRGVPGKPHPGHQT